MPSNLRGSVRRSQIINTYGVGAIVAVKEESFMVAGLDEWTVSEPDIHEPRLQSKLKVQGFVRPPASGDDKRPDIPVVRFPLYQSCPSCKRLDLHYKISEHPSSNHCQDCGVPLVPSRFITVCARGHIDDFPFWEWAHFGKEIKDVPHDLSLESSGVSSSLSDVVIKCSCGVEQPMFGAFGQDAMRGVRGCRGKRPWLGDSEECKEIPRTLQRGASNVYFAVTQSALSIPPWSEGALKILDRRWAHLQYAPDDALRTMIEGAGWHKGTPYSVDDLVDYARQRRTGKEGELDNASLREQEYKAFLQGAKETDREQDFVCERGDLDTELEEWFDLVMVAKRLREVRALQAFTRLRPPPSAGELDNTNNPAPLAALSREEPKWLPAVEVLGEGVFLRLREEKLAEWENEKVKERGGKINQRYIDRYAEFKVSPPRIITPRLVLIHTLAHMLINQWALDCGYPASSLKERLYVGDTMNGLLIYTATTDAAGSLGGVAAQAAPGRLSKTLKEAVARTSWCSADPLCIETTATGVDSLNLAACHSCVLLPEVSCDESNLLLDRGLLVGTPKCPELAFFASLLTEI